MKFSSPILLFTPDEDLVASLRRLSDHDSNYLALAPEWDAFSRLAAQLAFGVVVVDFSVLMNEDGHLEPEMASSLIHEALEANSQARILVFNIPDEDALGHLMANGIHDLMRSPLSLEELGLRIDRACKSYAWHAQRDYYVGQSGHIFQVDDIVGSSTQMQQVFEEVRKVAPSRTPVLVIGETGSGKELIAAAIHYNSPRKDQAFIKVNCAALPDTLLESELFGHEKGSFTGAVKQRIGRFEQAHGGTLFLDEVADMSAATQAKLLRVLESQEFERLGGTRLVRVDVRIIAATNQVLEKAIAEGSFRDDLYFRLNVVTIALPPLRERPTDIPQLARFFLKKAKFEERKNVRDFSFEAMEFMQSYRWPGNVRELENTIARAVLLSDGDYIEPEDLSIYKSSVSLPVEDRSGSEEVPADTPIPARAPTVSTAPDSTSAGTSAGDVDLKNIEKTAIIQALEASAFVQSRAARLLGISRRSLNYKISKYGITHPSWRVNTP